MNSGINPKEKDYELARENTVAMNWHFSNGTGSRRNYLL